MPRTPQLQRQPTDVIASAIVLWAQEERDGKGLNPDPRVLRRYRQTSVPRNRGEIPHENTIRNVG